MPTLERPEGVELHWEARGDGPLVVVSSYWSMHPSAFERLTDELASDHRVVRYDDRGAGESTRAGPYDIETATDDLEAIAEAAGDRCVVVCTADGCNRAVRVAARRPELVEGVVTVGGAPFSRDAMLGYDSMVGSETVVNAFLEMASTDYRGALRSLLGATNPQMNDDELRERVRLQADYSPGEAAIERLRAWAADDDALEPAKAAGDRLWFLHSPGMSGGWFPQGPEYEEMVKRALPEAHVLEVGDGFVTRPDETAAVVRMITAPTAASIEPA